MSDLKHYKEISLKSGKVVYAFNPSLTLQKKLGVGYEQYSCREDAIARALKAAKDFSEYKRTGRINEVLTAKTVGGLIDAYKLTAGWRRIAKKQNSKRAYENSLKTALSVRLNNGKLLKDSLFVNVKPLEAEMLYSHLCQTKGVNAANQAIKVLGVVWSSAIRLQLTLFNPFAKMTLEDVEKSTVVWSPDQVSQFVAMADQLSLSSIGTIVTMAYDLCQRPGDCRQMLWVHYAQRDHQTNTYSFQFEQEKSGSAVDVPVTDRLAQRLTNHLRISNGNPSDPIVVYENTGRPYSERLYRKKAELVREAAGLPAELKVMFLRHTGATEMGEADCTEDEIRSVTGHKSRQVLNLYVRPTRKMAVSAQSKRRMAMS